MHALFGFRRFNNRYVLLDNDESLIISSEYLYVRVFNLKSFNMRAIIDVLKLTEHAKYFVP